MEDVRLILIGSTLETASRLRGVDGVELIRARTALDALGEIACPMEGAREDRTAVLAPEGTLGEEEAGAFVAAVKRLAPATLVASMGPVNGAGSHFDAGLPLEADAAEIAALFGALGPAADAPADLAPADLVMGGGVSVGGASVGDVSAEAEPAPVSAAENDTPPPGVLFSSEVLEHALRGGDPLAPCVRRLRRTLGSEDVSFGVVAPGEGANAARVTHQGAGFGWLSSVSVPADALQQAARWLAGWLALAEQMRQLRDAAFTDELTGAWNRRYFLRFLAGAIDRARARRNHLTLMVYDIDDFKTYNDKYGHAAGDQILEQTARLMRSVVRPTDRVCRIGGDEFAVVFDEPEGPRSQTSKPPTSIGEIARRFQRAVCEQQFPALLEEAPGTLTISGGLATFPWDGYDADSLLKQADEFAMASKRQGKNLLTFGPGATHVCQTPPPGEEPV